MRRQDQSAAPASPSSSSAPGLAPILPRPEATNFQPYVPGIRMSPQLDLIVFSGVTAYPPDVDPWNPGRFRLPFAPGDRAAMANAHLDALLRAAGTTWQHVVSSTSYASTDDDDRELLRRMGSGKSCGTSVRVPDIGIPGVTALNEIVAAAPHRPVAAQGYVPGIEPVLPGAGVSLRDLPQAPAIRITASVDLVYFPAVTAYPLDADPWDSGVTLPADAALQERLIERNLDLLLRMAGVTWRHIVHLKVTGAAASLATLGSKLGDWRPCRTTRAVPTGLPGAALMCELTAVALTEERVD